MFKKEQTTLKKQIGSRNLKGLSKDELLELIGRHKDINPGIIRLIHQIPESVLTNLASKEARMISKMVKQIFRELERVKQFTRTKLNDHGILYGEVQFHHHIEDLIIEYFHERFPKCWLCLKNCQNRKCLIWKGKDKWFYSKDSIKENLIFLNNLRPKDPYFEDIQVDNEDMFNAFYKTQYIPSRKNPRYYRQMIPIKSRELPGLKGKIETSLENKKLDNFLLKVKENSKKINT